MSSSNERTLHCLTSVAFLCYDILYLLFRCVIDCMNKIKKLIKKCLLGLKNKIKLNFTILSVIQNNIHIMDNNIIYKGKKISKWEYK